MIKIVRRCFFDKYFTNICHRLILLSVIINSGEDVIIHYKTKYKYTFTCVYDFSSYPFDIQDCPMKFSLQETIGGSCQPLWGENNIQIYSKEETISMYDVHVLRYDIQTTINSTMQSHFTVYMLLERVYNSYLLTTFIPCIVLCILGSITMIAFRPDNFTDRVTVTISLLIVVASLFSQVVSTLPSSPASKCVEIFFFYVTVRLAYVFLMHTLVDRVLAKSNNSEKNNLVSTSEELENNNGSWVAPNVSKDGGSNDILRRAIKINKIGWILGFVADAFFSIELAFYVLQDRDTVLAKFHSYTLGNAII